jgi:pyruvate formate lyase activating enzyme
MRAPLVVDVKRGSLDDGPGMRSVVFLKGCPLRCVWCQNPETVRPRAEIERLPGSCIGCRSCETACPAGRARPAAETESARDCRVCRACVDACPSAARRVSGEAMTAAALVARLLRDAPFYRRSGGGVTLSGGEPALYPEWLGEVARSLRERGVHVLLETCGHFEWARFAEHLLPHVSTIFFDLKLADPARHARFTGRTNERIHENLRRLVAGRAADVLPRVPLVPGITDDEENLRALAALVRALGLRRMALLPYNPLWVPKRRALGGRLEYDRETFMSDEELARCRSVVTGAGLELAA